MKGYLLGCIILFCQSPVFCASKDTLILQIIKQPIKVHGKASFVYRVKQPDGTLGIQAVKGQEMNIVVQNKIDQPSSIHWHGIILPNPQDGVPYVTPPPNQVNLTTIISN